MPRKLLKKGLVAIALTAIVVVAVGVAFVEAQLRQVAGAFTDVVDRTSFSVAAERVALVDIHVLSPDGEQMLPSRTVLINEGRIVSITPSDTSIGFDENTRVIDGNGLWLVPGLIDTHVHLRHSENDLLLYVANGVTNIAEMSGENHHLAWRRETGSGAVGPGMFIASRKLGNWGTIEGWWQAWTRHRISVGYAQNAAATVNNLKRDGYDAVKIGTFVNADTYREANRAADEAGIRPLGHIPLSVGFDEVFSSSQDQVAHIEELVKALNMEFGPFNSGNTEEFLAYVRERAPQVARRLREHGTTVSTTIWLVDSIPRQKLDISSVLNEIALPYANPGQVEGTHLSPGWLASNNPYSIEPDSSEEYRAALHHYWTASAQAHHIMLRAMIESAVRVVAGTDAGNAVVVPGFSLHDELQALVDAGLSNQQSLRTATIAAGEWLADGSGCIAPGCRADLVLLQDNPLKDIANTRRIDTVILGGRVFDTGQLAAMLEAVKTANDASRSIPLR